MPLAKYREPVTVTSRLVLDGPMVTELEGWIGQVSCDAVPTPLPLLYPCSRKLHSRPQLFFSLLCHRSNHTHVFALDLPWLPSLTELCPQQLVQQHGRVKDKNILYASSRDGFSNAAFHDACDEMAPTVTFVLLQNKRCVEECRLAAIAVGSGACAATAEVSSN
eukprot:1586505-Rhodomonas_salina.1